MYQVSFVIHEDDEDVFTERLFSLGAGSVSSCKSDDNEVTLMALFDDVSEMKQFFSEDQYVVHKIAEEVWKNRWLEEYMGFPVNETIYIIPVTADTRPPDRYRWVIRLDPRDAFGDGRHPTTSLCLIKLEEYLSPFNEEDLRNLQIVDVGTGTGILSILAAEMGVRAIDALDIEEAAVINAGYNAQLNNCPDIAFFTSDIAGFRPDKTYDLVIANLLTHIVKSNISHLIALMKERGTLILSGISNRWHHEVVALIKSSALEILDHVRRDGWNCYVIKKANRAERI